MHTHFSMEETPDWSSRTSVIFVCVSRASAKRGVKAHYESCAKGVVGKKDYTSICIPLSCSIVLAMLRQTVQGGDNLQSCGKTLFHVILKHVCKEDYLPF